MPMHDWTCVNAVIFHDFHHEWISEIKRALNRGLLPPDYYALAEQVAAGFGPDVLTLQDQTIAPSFNGGGTATYQRPKTTYYTELPGEFKQRRKSAVAVRHVSGDHGWLTKDDRENGRRDRQAARVAADLRRRGAATTTRLGHAGTVGRSSPVLFSDRTLTTEITDTTDKRIEMKCVMQPDGDG
jgi:hypothetical protein